MYEILISLHIRAMNFRAKFLEIGDDVSKLNCKFYYIMTSLTGFDLKSIVKFEFRCSKI